MIDKMNFFTVSITFLLFLSCTTRNNQKENNPVLQQGVINHEVASVILVKLEVATYQNESTLSGWGYDIYADDALYIHQPHIPAVPGIQGFISEQMADRAGNFAVYKIRNNIMPPTISVKELDSLGVLKL